MSQDHANHQSVRSDDEQAALTAGRAFATTTAGTTSHPTFSSITVCPVFKVYVGGPIDFVDKASKSAIVCAAEYARDSNRLVAELRSMLGVRGRVYAAWEGTQAGAQTESHRALQEKALDECDLMIAFLPKGIVTYGTPIEIYRVASAGKRVLVIGSGESEAIRQIAGVQRVGDVDAALAATRGNLGWLLDSDLGASEHAVDSPIDSIAAVTLALPVQVDQETGAWALPVRYHDDDAGLDLHVTRATTIGPGEFVDIPAGVRVELPVGSWGLILGRSSSIRRRGLLVYPGVVDVGYRGDIFAGALNVGKHTQTLEVGDRLAQLILVPNLTELYTPRQVESLSEHVRGSNGFGSTGGH